MTDSADSLTTDEGHVLDRAFLDNALKPLAKYFIPKNRLQVREKALGRGGYGVVKLAELITDDRAAGGSVTVAVKVLQTDSSKAPPLRVAFRLTREMVAWSSCNHENILPFVGYFLSQDLETAYLVSPFVRNGNVKDYLANRQAKVEERLELIRDTLRGLEYLHRHDPPIIHGDLKSLNVLVNDDRRAVLCDFGLAVAVKNDDVHSGLTTSSDFKGSTRWCSSEVLMGEDRTLKSDIWGWGCLALEIMTGNPPFHEIRSDAGVILVLCGEPSKRKTPEPVPIPTFPNGLLELLRKCWAFDQTQRPDATTCMAAISPVPTAEVVRIWEDARWLDNWIMEYIPMFENTIQGCISNAALSPDVAQRLCNLSSFSRGELEDELHDLQMTLQKDTKGKLLSQLNKKYLTLREATIRKEVESRRQQLVVTATGFIRTRSSSSSAPGRRVRDPVAHILRTIGTLRRPLKLSRDQVGDILRELYTLLKDEVAPLDSSRYLWNSLPGFERLVRHYPDDWHPDVARFLIDVLYEHHVRRGNHVLCLEIAKQAADRYRELSRTNGNFLSRRAESLEKVVTSYDILGFHENARLALAEAIWVYQQLNTVTGNQQAFQIPLARTLVRYHQVLGRLGRDWNDSDVVDALWEAVKIYNTRVWWGQGNGLEQFGGDLADALVELDLTLLRKGDRVEALKVEDQLMHLYRALGEEDQLAEVKRRRDSLLLGANAAVLPNAVTG